MDLYLEDPKNTNAIMFAMATLSPKAADSLETENYRFTAENDLSTEQYILEDAFHSLIKDLDTIGVLLKFDYTNYVNDRETLCKFLKLCSYILPNILYPKIKTDSILRSIIERIASGDLGDGGTFLQVYLSELGGLDDDLPVLPDLTDYIDSIYQVVDQSDNFSDYMKNLIFLYESETLTINSDQETHTLYKEKISDIFASLVDFQKIFAEDSKYRFVLSMSDRIIQDFLSPVNFSEYSYLLLHNEETIPEDLIEGYKRKWQYYFMSHSWCYDYYNLRHIDLEENDERWSVILMFLLSLKAAGFDFDSEIQSVELVYPNREELNKLKGFLT